MPEPPTHAEPPDGPTDSEVLAVAPGVRIPRQELTWRFSASGGRAASTSTPRTRDQKSASDAAHSPSLPEWARARIVEQLGPQVTAVASDSRSQARNRALALARLTAQLSGALRVSRPRFQTRPTLASQRRRLEAKRRHGDRKRQRRLRPGSDDTF